MIVSHRASAIFVHIQKTGGTSIEAVLRAYDPGAGSHLVAGQRHVHAAILREIVGTGIWNSYFKFAFVRNPWDRLVSWYQMCTQVSEPNAFCRYVREGFPTFASFVTGAVTGPGAKTARNQLDYITDADGTQIIDFVGRFENLETDFALVRERLKLAGRLPRVNVSQRGDYRAYYSDATREIVAARFARDISAFGYHF